MVEPPSQRGSGFEVTYVDAGWEPDADRLRVGLVKDLLMYVSVPPNKNAWLFAYAYRPPCAYMGKPEMRNGSALSMRPAERFGSRLRPSISPRTGCAATKRRQ